VLTEGDLLDRRVNEQRDGFEGIPEETICLSANRIGQPGVRCREAVSSFPLTSMGAERSFAGPGAMSAFHP
jgi:hypothetical protein